MKNTNIEWTDSTFNPWEGCTKVSPGCANCYAETRNARFGGGTAPNWGKGAPRRRTSAENWKQPIKWNREAHETHLKHYMKVPFHLLPRPRVFCASLADWLDDEVPVEWLADLLAVIESTPHLDWLLLTKRPENWRERIGLAAVELTKRRVLHRLHHWQCGEPPANVWIGTSVEDQDAADTRIHHLLSIPARVRFLSMEPLLGPVHLGGALYSDYDKAARQDQLIEPAGGFTNAKVNWIIVGGESGTGARGCCVDWATDIMSQCNDAGTAFFMKQFGALAYTTNANLHDWPDDAEFEAYGEGAASARILLRDKKGGDMAEWPEELRVQEFPS